MRKLKIAITIGDFNGIGPEVALKSVALPGIRKICDPILIGPLEIFEWHAKRMKRRFRFQPIDSTRSAVAGRTILVWDLGIFHARDIQLGTVSPIAGTAAALAIHKGATLCLSGEVMALVTAPVSKAALNLAGYFYPGQT